MLFDEAGRMGWLVTDIELVADIEHPFLLMDGSLGIFKFSVSCRGTTVISSLAGGKRVWTSLAVLVIGLNPNCRRDRRVPAMNLLARDGGGLVGTGCWLSGSFLDGC